VHAWARACIYVCHSAVYVCAFCVVSVAESADIRLQGTDAEVLQRLESLLAKYVSVAGLQAPQTAQVCAALCAKYNAVAMAHLPSGSTSYL